MASLVAALIWNCPGPSCRLLATLWTPSMFPQKDATATEMLVMATCLIMPLLVMQQPCIHAQYLLLANR